MSWSLKPYIPDGYLFEGQMVWPSTDIEIPDIKKFVESVSIRKRSKYVNKYTGFETKKYQIEGDTDIISFNINLIGILPKYLADLFLRLANATNGAGMIIMFYDDWITGTEVSPVTYYCRWTNAGDFVDSSALLSGGNLQLISYGLPSELPVEEYQDVINTPASGLEWQDHIDVGTNTEYQRTI